MSIDTKKIDEQTFNALLHLSSLSSESTNLDFFKKQVDEIAVYYNIICQFDDLANPQDAYSCSDVMNLREDEIVKSLEIPDIKKITPEFMDGYFRVPKVLGEGV
ncbi:MAG: Asp-tRNA(Asn)/Glu-tRNA(Gln) amidotransferase GatCAB subunit C [Treponema sp.]|nr:Asp-tRNA(Asn)/Glu-tRNA(Gln) amidotransferase GatCAB subunit C [Treponema sp.]